MIRIIRIPLIIILCLVLVQQIDGQSHKLDSLWNKFNNAAYDTTRIKILNEGIGFLYENIYPDSAILFYNQAIELVDKNYNNKTTKLSKEEKSNNKKLISLKAKSLRYIGIVYKSKGAFENAIKYYAEALIIYEELNRLYPNLVEGKAGMSNCYNNIGTVYNYQDSYDKAIEYYSKALKIKKEQSDKYGMSACYINIGNVYYNQGLYDKAIEFYLKSLKIAEAIDDKPGMSYCYMNIGLVTYYQASYDKAITYFQKALEIAKELGDKSSISTCYNNIGLAYESQGLFEKSLEYYKKALKIAEEIDYKSGLLNCYTNIANIFKYQVSYDNAIKYYNKALAISEDLGDKSGLVLCYINLASLNHTFADSVAFNEKQRLNYLDKAVKYGIKAFEIADEIKSTSRINEAAGNLMEIYDKLGDYEKSIEYAKIFISTNDSMFSEEKTKSLAEMGAKYESEKRELTIQKLEKEKELQQETIARKEAESKKQKVLILSFLMGFVIILIFSIFLYRLFVQKKKANLLLAEQKEEIITQRDEIIKHRDLVVEQKEEIEDSINYAKRIQEAVLPVSDLSRSILGEHFILFQPKDIVSGDFYWTAEIQNRIIVVAADCTGHGVPGAFMSMLGISFLNEIVRKQEVTQANQVLNQLRLEIINALQQSGKEGEQKDGMDLALVVINKETNYCEFAGANNPLYIIRDSELQEIKADKMPIAIYLRMNEFTNHEFELNKGDSLYMFSDGYPDQFGGSKDKKFMSKNFKKLLLENSKKPMSEQKEILEKTMKNWIGNGEQIDDITVLGIKI